MTAIKDAQAIILWCRKEGIAWDKLTIGALTIEGSDMRGHEGLPKVKQAAVRKPPSIQMQYGAALLEAAAESDGMTSVVEED